MAFLPLEKDIFFSVATPAEPRGEKKKSENFGQWKTFKMFWKVPVNIFKRPERG